MVLASHPGSRVVLVPAFLKQPPSASDPPGCHSLRLPQNQFIEPRLRGPDDFAVECRQGAIGRIALANPPLQPRRSQFSECLRQAVHDASESDIRVLVVQTEGPHFSLQTCTGGSAKDRWTRNCAVCKSVLPPIRECSSSRLLMPPSVAGRTSFGAPALDE
jgi:hypothetical protein